MASKRALSNLLMQVRACTECAVDLPLGPRPVLQTGLGARLLIVGQAPGAVVHETGTPWDDKSGDRLREWLGMDRKIFYDAEKVALVPMGFCYPGRKSKGGDAPPRPECAPLWHARLREQLPNIELTLLTGMYAQRYYLDDRARRTLTDTVVNWRDYTPEFLPTPHPSWRSANWIKKNPWFETDLLPWLRRRVRRLF